MRILINYITVYFCVFLSLQLVAQDVVRMNLTANPVLIDKSRELRSNGLYKLASVTDTIKLDTINGILDDFSYSGPYPDSSIWLDRMVFINRTYAYSPPTIGVATFDGLNEQGYPYDFTADEFSSRGADSLTSKPIDLRYDASDSIYFSFSYQPQGLGNSPAKRDSLVLEFKAPGGAWDLAWKCPGSPISFKDTIKWKYVIIPVINPNYLKRGFQFRFRNYATLSGNLDHWHIDYVYLNKDRKYIDAIDDVSYVYNCPPLIKKYYVMPWRQYTTDDSKSFVLTPLRVNSSVDKNVKRLAVVKDKNATQLTKWEDSDNIQPFLQAGYTLDSVIVPTFPLMTSPISYFSESVLNTTPDKQRQNDTLRHEQKFGDYFAYDDGTAESAFGLNKAGASLAVKFKLAVNDTLRYVDIYFNPILIDAEKLTFYLKVWGDGGTQPGAPGFTGSELSPKYTKTGLNGFVRYSFDQPVALAPGIFYVGISQPSNLPLGVGQDLNTNNQLNTFYDIGDGWNTFPYPGTAMLRPVFGKDSTIIGVKEIKKSTQFVKVYPNPATTVLNVVSTDSFNHHVVYTILDVFGREMITGILKTPMNINIMHLSKGAYFIRFSEENKSCTYKFIKIE